MPKKSILLGLIILIFGFSGIVFGQQIPEKTNAGPQSVTERYSYMGGKEHYLPNSPNYMAGKRQYLPDSPYYMVGKEQYFQEPPEEDLPEGGQIPAPGEEIYSGGGEEFEYPEGGQNWVDIIITPEGPFYYYGGGIPHSPIIRPKPHVGIKRPTPHVTITAPRFGNFYRLNQGMRKFR